jgi:hypothetical protein
MSTVCTSVQQRKQLRTGWSHDHLSPIENMKRRTLTRRDERGTDVLISEPSHDSHCRELRAIVDADVPRLSVEPHRPRERRNHILRPELATDLHARAIPGVLLQLASQLQGCSTGQAVVDKVIGQEMSGLRCAKQADVRAALAPSGPTPRKLRAQLLSQATRTGLT